MPNVQWKEMSNWQVTVDLYNETYQFFAQERIGSHRYSRGSEEFDLDLYKKIMSRLRTRLTKKPYIKTQVDVDLKLILDVK